MHAMRMSDVIGTLWTIGHSTRDWEVFAGMLGEFRIEVLADVRRFAGSRRNPQFSPLALAPALAAAGREYEPMPGCVGRLRPRPGAPNAAWRASPVRATPDHQADPTLPRTRE